MSPLRLDLITAAETRLRNGRTHLANGRDVTALEDFRDAHRLLGLAIGEDAQWPAPLRGMTQEQADGAVVRAKLGGD